MTRMPSACWKRWYATTLWLLLQCGLANLALGQNTSAEPEQIVVAITDSSANSIPRAGSTARGSYSAAHAYAGSTRAQAQAEELAHEYGLEEIAAWTITALQWRCMLYRLPPDIQRDELITKLRGDNRVQLAQALQHFETLATPTVSAQTYNDPYLQLQSGFLSMHAQQAQRLTQGQGVRVAIIDTGIDRSHPDLVGRIRSTHDFARINHPMPTQGERHGTQIAGVIAALANNATGIVGIAPRAELLAIRACWEIASGPARNVGDPPTNKVARCDSFTLAQALMMAVTLDADIINLSLGGPHDPLLTKLTQYALQRGTIVIGAVPPNGQRDGFPIDVPGVLAVNTSTDQRSNTGPTNDLLAPGRDVLSLTPGGHYDYASGSSLAAAHISGTVALLRSIQPSLRADAVHLLLRASGARFVNACTAVQGLHSALSCQP